jgi:hypothetical protein
MDYTPHEAFLVRDRVTQATVSFEEAEWAYTPWIHPVPAPADTIDMTTNPAAIWADGTSTSTISATVMTAYGYPAQGSIPITFTTSAGTLPTSPYTTTTTDGAATVVLTSSTDLATATVTSMVSSTVTGATTVEFVAGPRASLRINDTPGAGGSEVSTYTVTCGSTLAVYVAAYDAHGRFMDNPTDVTWGGTGVVAGRLTPTAGTSSTTFTPGLPGTGTITVADGDGHSDATDTITVVESGKIFLPVVMRNRN